MLKYKIVKKRNALHAQKQEMFYPRLTESRKYNMDQVADLISERCSLTKADIFATLVSMEDVIPELLIVGQRVELGRLGAFSLQANAETSTSAAAVSWRSFKRLFTRFHPGKALSIRLSDVHFRRGSKG